MEKPILFDRAIKFASLKKDEYKKAKGIEKKNISKKFPFVKKRYMLPSLDTLLYQDDFIKDYTEKDITDFITYFIDKIRGIYKHAQSSKTHLCNLSIIHCLKTNKNIICISKNILESKNQWLDRLLKDIKEAFPTKDIKNIVYGISSEKNKDNVLYNHCKNIKEFNIKYLSKKDNDPVVVFMCSNVTRIYDVIQLLEAYNGMKEEKKLKIEIQVDEAHNKSEGIPCYREQYETILLSPYVSSLVPCTATIDNLVNDSSNLWKRKNLENNGVKYTECRYKSNSPEYSSLHCAKPIYFEDMRKNILYTQYGITEFDKDDFIKLDNKDYSGYDEEEIIEDRERRRQLEFCSFMNKEKLPLNDAFNIIDNINGDIKPTFGIHLMHTPCRNIFTYTCGKHACKKGYNVMCIYNSSITLMYNNREEIYIPKDGQMNDKIYEILNYLKSKGINTDKPFYIISNYKPSGESITFVNYKYGPLDSVCKCYDSNSTEDYQAYSRLNYEKKKFIEYNSNFTSPPKYMYGSKSSIEGSLLIEKMNDARIDNMNMLQIEPDIISMCNSKQTDDNDISIPAKGIIHDPDDEYCIEFKKLSKLNKRNKEEKQNILKYLKFAIANGSIEWIDKTGKFSFDDYTLTSMRSYNKESKPSDYRFESYCAAHNQGDPFINQKNKISKKECDLLCCNDRFVHNGHTNFPHTFWISYKF
jgi:hypothetical protein